MSVDLLRAPVYPYPLSMSCGKCYFGVEYNQSLIYNIYLHFILFKF